MNGVDTVGKNVIVPVVHPRRPHKYKWSPYCGKNQAVPRCPSRKTTYIWMTYILWEKCHSAQLSISEGHISMDEVYILSEKMAQYPGVRPGWPYSVAWSIYKGQNTVMLRCPSRKVIPW